MEDGHEPGELTKQGSANPEDGTKAVDEPASDRTVDESVSKNLGGENVVPSGRLREKQIKRDAQRRFITEFRIHDDGSHTTVLLPNPAYGKPDSPAEILDFPHKN